MSKLKHIVMWKFADEAEGSPKEYNMQYVRKGLSALMGVVPELLDMEIHRDTLCGDGSFDMILICTFEDMDAMQAYQVHPKHMEMRKFIRKVITARSTVDYVVED